MKIRKGDILELEIEKMAFKGKGVAKIQMEDKQFTVFVNGVVVGDLVNGMVVKVKKRWAEAKLIELLQPSPDRIDAKCKHFETCGGCTFQSISYEDQLKIKKQFVVDAFERIGMFKDAPIQDVLASPKQWFYRNKMELSFGETAERDFALGFHIPRRRYDIFKLEECYLQSEELQKIVAKVFEFMKDVNALPVNSKNEGDLYTLTIREGKNTDERMLILTTSAGPFDWMSEFTELVKSFNVSSFYWAEKIVQKGSPTRIVEHHLFGEELLHEKLNVAGKAFTFSIEPQAFFQPNTLGAELLYAEVIKQLEAEGDEVLFDLYCGTGTIGIVLAPYVKKVIGVEINEQAVSSAERNAQLNGIENVEFIAGDTAKVLPEMSEKPDFVILDPPRAGLMPKAVEQVIEFRPQKIIYVSCNPSTLARDCQLFAENGYQLMNVQPVDMFPQSYHVENVAVLAYNG